MKKTLCTMALCVTLFSTIAGQAQAASLSVHGSTVVIAAALDPNKKAIESETGLTFDVVGNSAGEGIEELAQGTTNVAMITGNLEDVVAKINTRKPGAVDKSSLKAFEIGKTRVAFAVHPSNPVNALTKDQLVKILNGELTNWKDVGGPNLPIILVTGVAATGLRSAVEKDYLGGASVTSKARTLVNSALIATVVEKAPNAIGIVVIDMMTPAMKEIQTENSEEIKMAYVTKGAPSPEAQKLIDSTLKHMSK